MVLVDTSVLIGYLRGLEGKPYQTLEDMIDRDIPFGINNFIYQETLQGAKTEGDFSRLKEYLETLPFYELNEGLRSFERAASMYFTCRKAGITIRSTIDLLIAETAIENNLYLLHHDSDFENLASVVKDLRLYL